MNLILDMPARDFGKVWWSNRSGGLLWRRVGFFWFTVLLLVLGWAVGR